MADVQLLAPPADIPALNSNGPASSEQAGSSAETNLSQTGSSSDPLRPAICYDRRLLLHLSKSLLIEAPKDMPAFTDWFGEWFEPVKKEPELNLAGRARFRRDGEETGDLPAREPSSRPARPTFSQPAQMGSFRHQSTIQSLKLDSTADKDGHERLRNLSDRFDRDRLRSMSGDQSLASLPQAANRRDRDAAPLNPSHRQGSSGSLSANPTARRDTRAPDRETIRPNGATRSAIHERSSTLTSKELSETRNDRSDDWRRTDRWDDRDRPPRERHAETRDRSRERGWERSRSREPRDRRGGWDVFGEKDKDPWYRASGGRDDDRRKEDEAPIVPLRSTRRERGGERERDKEPAWMDDWPDSAPSGTGKGLVLGAVNGEDKLQAWKKSMKEKDTPAAAEPSAQEASSPPDGLQDGLNDIERFKLQMKQAQAQKDQETNAPTPPTAPLANGAPPGLNGLPSDPAIVSAPPPTFVADPAIVSASTPGSAVPSPSPRPVGSGADGLRSLGLSSAAQTPSGSSTPNPNPDSVSLFQTLFNQNPPPQSTAPSSFPQETPPNLTPIDVKPTAQNVFASFLNESRHPPKSNGISSNTSSVIRSPDIDPPLSSAASVTSTSSRTVPPGNLPLLSGAAGGRTSKFAKFFSQQPTTPKDESGPSMAGLGSGLPPPNGPTNPLLSHQSLPSLGGRDPMSMNHGNMGLHNGPISGLPNGVVNGMGHPMGLGGPGGMGMGGRIASPTQHGHFAVQQQQQQPQMINAPPRLGGGTTTPDALAGLFANAERGMGQLNNPAAPTGGTMEGLLAALDASARGQPPSRGSSRFPQQPMNKPGGGPFGMLPGQQPSGLPSFSPQGGLPPMAQHQQAMFSPNGLSDTADRFVADGLVPGLRPQRPRESSLSLGAGGLYGPDMEAERDQLARQFQNLHMGGVNGAGLPPLGPPLHQQQLFEQRQQLARQQQQQQTLYANQGQNQNRNVLAGMMGVGNGVVPGMGRPTPSPIGNQNPALMQQRGQPQQQQQPRDLNISLMNLGLGGGMRTPQDLVGAAGLGQPRTPQELAHAGLLRGAGGVDLFGGNQQQGQFGGQQGRLANLGNFGGLGAAGVNPQGGPATGPLNVPNVGAPGTADYALHSQQLQAARASAAAQQQAQMMQHLGIGMGGAGRGGLPGPLQGQQGQQQRMPSGPQQQMMGGVGPLDGFLGAGGPANLHMHANHPGGPPSHLPPGNAEQFLQLFLGANAGRGE